MILFEIFDGDGILLAETYSRSRSKHVVKALAAQGIPAGRACKCSEKNGSLIQTPMTEETKP